MPPELFDRNLRQIRRDRAALLGPDLLLLDRAFDECFDRLRDITRPFKHALLLGCPSPNWPSRLSLIAGKVDVFDPGPLFAAAAGGTRADEDRFDFGVAKYDLCLAVGTLDTVNDLPVALQLLRQTLEPDSPLIGAIAGGNSLSTLRAVLIEAGRNLGRVVARTHPRIDAATLAQLLGSAGFIMPVVDVDRVQLRYSDLNSLVRDLRSMAATSLLNQRSPPMTKGELDSARRAFRAMGDNGRIPEQVEILHFLAWTQ